MRAIRPDCERVAASSFPPMRPWTHKTGRGESGDQIGRATRCRNSASLNRKSPARSGWGQEKRLEIPSYPDHSEALLKLRPILTTGIRQQHPLNRPIEEAFFAHGDQQMRIVSTSVFLVLSRLEVISIEGKLIILRCTLLREGDATFNVHEVPPAHQSDRHRFFGLFMLVPCRCAEGGSPPSHDALPDTGFI